MTAGTHGDERPEPDLGSVLRRLAGLQQLLGHGGPVLQQLSEQHVLPPGPDQPLLQGGVDRHARRLPAQVRQLAGRRRAGQSQQQQEKELKQQANQRAPWLRGGFSGGFFIWRDKQLLLVLKGPLFEWKNFCKFKKVIWGRHKGQTYFM